jgi:DNA-binding MarR family transcriptional regulator
VPDRDRLKADPIAEAHRHWTERGWQDAADGMAAIASLMRAHQLVLARVEPVLRPFDITFARYEVLMLLAFSSRGSLPMRVIGSRLQVHQTSVTNAVDRLEKAGLVRRVAHPRDRRTTLVEITDAGHTLADQATQVLNREVFADPGLDPEQIHILFDILATFRRRAGDFS